jgi:hypothetical protein
MGFGSSPQTQQGGARCVQGHVIPPGGSFCLEGGHPIAQDKADPYGPTGYGQGQPPPMGPPPMGPPPMGPPPGMGPPPSAIGAPPMPPGKQAATGERRALAGFLVSYQDDANGKYWPLWQGKNAIGRADTGQKVDIEIAHGTTSTHHATVDCDPQRFILSDLGSTNGTFHNEEAIGFQGKREVRDGDKIRFGGYSVMVVNVVSRT